MAYDGFKKKGKVTVEKFQLDAIKRTIGKAKSRAEIFTIFNIDPALEISKIDDSGWADFASYCGAVNRAVGFQFHPNRAAHVALNPDTDKEKVAELDALWISFQDAYAKLKFAIEKRNFEELDVVHNYEEDDHVDSAAETAAQEEKRESKHDSIMQQFSEFMKQNEKLINLSLGEERTPLKESNFGFGWRDSIQKSEASPQNENLENIESKEVSGSLNFEVRGDVSDTDDEDDRLAALFLAQCGADKVRSLLNEVEVVETSPVAIEGDAVPRTPSPNHMLRFVEKRQVEANSDVSDSSSPEQLVSALGIGDLQAILNQLSPEQSSVGRVTKDQATSPYEQALPSRIEQVDQAVETERSMQLSMQNGVVAFGVTPCVQVTDQAVNAAHTQPAQQLSTQNGILSLEQAPLTVDVITHKYTMLEKFVNKQRNRLANLWIFFAMGAHAKADKIEKTYNELKNAIHAKLRDEEGRKKLEEDGRFMQVLLRAVEIVAGNQNFPARSSACDQNIYEKAKEFYKAAGVRRGITENPLIQEKISDIVTLQEQIESKYMRLNGVIIKEIGRLRKQGNGWLGLLFDNGFTKANVVDAKYHELVYKIFKHLVFNSETPDHLAREQFAKGRVKEQFMQRSDFRKEFIRTIELMMATEGTLGEDHRWYREANELYAAMGGKRHGIFGAKSPTILKNLNASVFQSQNKQGASVSGALRSAP